MMKLFAFRTGLTSVVRYSLPVALAALLVPCSRADETRFFRIAGPVPTTIADVTADGIVTWTNLATNATFTVQTTKVSLGQSNWTDWVQVPASNAVTVGRIFDPDPPFGMAFIPAGIFRMGATTNMGHEAYTIEVPQHTVYVSAFYMERYEVTKALWDDVYAWATNHGYVFDIGGPAQGKAANHPVQQITWFEAVKWCNARSEKEGKMPAYYTSTAQDTVYRVGQVNLGNSYVKWNSGYRLPTEAEWEKAARGGAVGKRFPWSDVNTIDHGQANYYSYWEFGAPKYAYDVNATSGLNPAFVSGGPPYTSPVGYFSANEYGLYDMAGNSREWCWDWREFYSGAPQSDPRGPSSGSYRQTRSGSWSDYGADSSRVANRVSYPPTDRTAIGFRCVLPSE